MTSDGGKRLDDILRKRSTGKPQALPPEFAQSLLFMRVERVLLLEIRAACKQHALALKTIETILEGEGGASELPTALKIMSRRREIAVTVINDYSAFSSDPSGWLAKARVNGRIAAWARFGIT